MATTTQPIFKRRTSNHAPASIPLSAFPITALPASSTYRQNTRDCESKDKNITITSDYGRLQDTFGSDFATPDYTINDIRKAIPSECYDRSTVKEYFPWYTARVVWWLTYGFINGIFATGLWVLAHECGHQALSNSKILNDTVGWILHSALLVPYFSWKITHGKHHKPTGHMERDMVFVPRTRAGFAKRFGIDFAELSELTEETPISSLLFVIVRQLFGWNVYLLTNDTGHDFHSSPREGLAYKVNATARHNGWFHGVNHFSPRSPLFEPRDAPYILLSDLGILITASLLYYIGHTWGIQSLLVWYGLPYVWVNHWLVAITYLQHTDASIPHYGSATWTFVRGAAATIDRDFGFIGYHLFHGITETHVLHHYVSTIPFYNADKASAAMKPIMGRHYRSSPKESVGGLVRRLYTNFNICQWVEPSVDAMGAGRDVFFFRNRRGLGVSPIDMRKGEARELFDGDRGST